MAATDEKNESTDESQKKDGLNPTIENKTATTGKRKMKKIWIVIGVLVLLIAGGLIFAVPYFKGTDGVSGHGESGPESAEEGDSEAKPLEVKTTFALDPFLVNLADNDDVRFVKASFKLGLAEEPEEEVTEMLVAAMRDSIITLLTSKTAEQILTPQDKVKLREQIKTRMNELTPDMNVVEVYIVDFVVQL